MPLSQWNPSPLHHLPQSLPQTAHSLTQLHSWGCICVTKEGTIMVLLSVAKKSNAQKITIPNSWEYLVVKCLKRWSHVEDILNTKQLLSNSVQISTARNPSPTTTAQVAIKNRCSGKDVAALRPHNGSLPSSFQHATPVALAPVFSQHVVVQKIQTM